MNYSKLANRTRSKLKLSRAEGFGKARGEIYDKNENRRLEGIPRMKSGICLFLLEGRIGGRISLVPSF